MISLLLEIIVNVLDFLDSASLCLTLSFECGYMRCEQKRVYERESVGVILKNLS